MGTGKTKRLLEYIIAFIDRKPDANIYIMSFRITFSNDLICKLNDYLTKQGK